VTGSPVRPRPNLIFNVLGVLLIAGGVVLTIVGLGYAVTVITGYDALNEDGPPVKIADAMALAFWGILVFTIGRYFWRGARKRGARDRFGRLLIIVGYVLLGVGLDRGVHAAVGLWGTTDEQAGQSAVLHTVVVVAVWGVPAAILAGIGFRMANEKALATASVHADL
jgi:hypothetical protein